MYNTRWNHRCALPLALFWYMCIFSNQEDQVDKIEVTFHTSDNVRIETTHPTATKLRELNMSPKLLTNYATLFAQTNLSTIQHQEAIQQIRVHVPPKLGEVLVREGFSHVVIRLECESIPLSAYGAECQDCDDSSIKVLSIFDSLLENESSSIEFISAQVHTLEAGVYVYMEDAPAILEMHSLNEIHDHVKFTKVLTLRDTDDMKDFIASQRSSIHPYSDFKILVASESDHHIRTEFISTDINSVVEVKFSDCTRYASMYKKSSFKIPMADEMHKQLIVGGQIVIKLDVPIRIIFEHREARSIFRLDSVKNCVESAYMRICKFLHVVENFSTHTLKAIMIQVLDGNEWGLLDFFVFSFTPLSRNFIEFKNFLTVTNGLKDVTASGEVEEKNLSDILSSIDEDRKHKNLQLEELFVSRCNELNSINEVIDFVKNHYPAKLRELENENHDTSRVRDSSLLMVQMQNLKTANLQLSKVNGELSNLSTTMKTLSENIETLLLEGKTGSKKIPKELDVEHIKITTLRNDVTSLSSEIAQHESSFTEAMQNVSRRRITHDASLNALEEKCDELQNRISQKTPQANSSSALPAHTSALISLSIVTFLLIVSLGILVYLFRGNFYNKFHRVNIKHEHCIDLEIDEIELEELYEREIQFATM